MHTSTCEVENQSEPAVSTENSTRCSVTIYIGKGPGKERIYVSRSAQFSRSVVSDSATPWTAAHQASLSITNSQSLLKLMSIELVMSSNHLILCCPLVETPNKQQTDTTILCQSKTQSRPSGSHPRSLPRLAPCGQKLA